MNDKFNELAKGLAQIRLALAGEPPLMSCNTNPLKAAGARDAAVFRH